MAIEYKIHSGIRNKQLLQLSRRHNHIKIKIKNLTSYVLNSSHFEWKMTILYNITNFYNVTYSKFT